MYRYLELLAMTIKPKMLKGRVCRLTTKQAIKRQARNFCSKKRMALQEYFLMNIAIFYLPRSWKESLTVFDVSLLLLVYFVESL
jgi:hypothetical protein